MNNLFCKLNKNFLVENYTVYDVQQQFGQENDGEFVGIRYSNVDFTNKSDIMNIIPRAYHPCFFMTIMRINTTIPPHTDSGIKSTINFYIKTDDCVTQFYKYKTNTPNKRQIENQTNGYIFDVNDLEKVDCFTAQPTEAWVLNVSEPHSVIPKYEFEDRLAIALSSELDYNTVCDILREEGYL